MPISPEQARSIAHETLISSLGVDREELYDDATIMGDLGAESIDSIDIQFRAERAVGSYIVSFWGKLHEALEGGMSNVTNEDGEHVMPWFAEDQLSTPDMCNRKLEQPYRSMPGTVARLVELIVRESEEQERLRHGKNA